MSNSDKSGTNRASLASFISDEAREQFHTDVVDNLTAMEDGLMQLESDPEQLDLIHLVFRAIHTIKGVAYMFEFTEIAEFSHIFEDLFVRVREREIPVDGKLIGLALKAHDVIEKMHQETDDPAETQAVQTELIALLPKQQNPLTADNLQDSAESAPTKQTFRIRFRFDPTVPVFDYATNPIAYLTSLCSMGLGKVLPHLQQLPSLDDLNPSICHIYWDIILATTASAEEIKDEFLFIEDDLVDFSITTQQTGREALANARQVENTPLKKESIKALIVDDEIPNRVLLNEILSPYCECDLVIDGQEAVDAVQFALEDGNPYQLICLDIMMPHLSGQKALKEIRNIEKAAGVTPREEAVIIMVSALNTPKDVMTAFRHGGCTDYLTKPITKDALLAKLKDYNVID